MNAKCVGGKGTNLLLGFKQSRIISLGTISRNGAEPRDKHGRKFNLDKREAGWESKDAKGRAEKYLSNI